MNTNAGWWFGVVVVISISFAPAGSAADEATMVRQGVAIAERPQEGFISNVVKLLASTSHQSTSYAVKANTRETLLKSDSYVLVKLDPPRRIDLMGPPPTDIQKVAPREPTLIEQILVPLLETEFPSHIYARSGTNVMAFTKYAPFSLRDVVKEPALKLRGQRPYKALFDLPGVPAFPPPQ